MLEYDADFSVNLHFEIDEEQAFKQGGISLTDVKKNIEELPEWIIGALNEFIEFGENDSVTVMPYDYEVVLNGKVIDLDDIEDEDEDEDENEDEDEDGDLDNSETVVNC